MLGQSAVSGGGEQMQSEALERLRNEPIDWRYKGFPPAEGVTPANIRDRKWNLLAGDLFLPALILKESALAHNLALMRRWCAEHGVSLAPHGKTTMTPEIFARQFEAGAWGLTAATPSQMRIYRAFGIDRIILANELVEPNSIRWLAAELAAHPDFEAFCLVDSVAAVARLEAVLKEKPIQRRVSVFVELGMMGGRTGARTVATALSVDPSWRNVMTLSAMREAESNPSAISGRESAPPPPGWIMISMPTTPRPIANQRCTPTRSPSMKIERIAAISGAMNANVVASASGMLASVTNNVSIDTAPMLARANWPSGLLVLIAATPPDFSTHNRISGIAMA